jgi:DNA-binding transcriptional LysR family regulator
MELRHLRYVVTLAETLHFGRAAERLNLSQPPLSQQVRQLEDELKVQLFHRTKRQVQLTEAGRMFVQEARVILAQAAHASNLASRMTRGQVGQLTVGVAGPADAPFFVEILRAFAGRYPRVHLVLRNLGSIDQTQAINEGRLHVGFVALPIDDAGLTTVTVIRQPILLALPPEHPLTALDRVPLHALAAEPQIMFARSNGPRFFDAVLAACRQAGFSMNIAHEVDNLYTACALVAAGLGVCFVPAGVQDGRSSSMVFRPVVPALPIEMEIALAYQPESASELVLLFVEVVKEVVARKAGPVAVAVAGKAGWMGGTVKKRKGQAPVASGPPSYLAT